MECKLCNDTGEVAKDILCSCEAGQKLMEGGDIEPYVPPTEKPNRASQGITKAFDFADSFLDFFDPKDDDDTDYDTDE